MENYHIAVFDIGKTNKKLLVYDRELHLLVNISSRFDAIEQNGRQEENVKAVFEWYLSQLAKLSGDFDIRAISISAHGATFAAMDEKGELAFPVISYTTEPGEEFHRRFNETFGEPVDLQKTTATADFKALINIAKGIFYLKETDPAQFDNIRHLLFYPQYFGYLLTGNHAMEKTYLGCHTYLWDYRNNTWSGVARDLKADRFFPGNLQKSWDILGKLTPEVCKKTGLSGETIVTTGIHDSNAALLPYLIAGSDHFILNSTGTWCVVMRPEEKVAFNEDDWGKTVFYNTSVFHKPVKTAIFMGGQEFATYEEIIKKAYHIETTPAYDQKLYEKIIEDRSLFILPSVVKGTGQFPESEARIMINGQTTLLSDLISGKTDPKLFEKPEHFYATLNISLALQTEVALKRAGIQKGMKVYVEGGFRKNNPYKWLLSAIFPDSEISLTELIEASAIGAAILGKAAIEKTTPSLLSQFVKIVSEPVEKVRMAGIEEYKSKFLELIGR